MTRAFVRRTNHVRTAPLRPNPIGTAWAGLSSAPLAACREQHIAHLAAATALHDLNNLLTGIAVTAALAEETLPPEHNLRSDLAAIRRATARGVELAGQLRNQSMPTMSCAIDLGTVLDELAPLIRALLGPQIEYHASLTANLGPIAGDHAQLERLILNLVRNARDAMPAGGVLRIELGAAGAGVRLSISDTGVGMSGATLARALEPGFTTRAHGSGLGLAICAEIVRQHAGSIRLASVLEQGTIVTVELPCAPGATADT